MYIVDPLKGPVLPVSIVAAAAWADDGTAQEVAEEQQGGLLHTGVSHHLPLRTRHHNVDSCIRFSPANSSVIKTPDFHKIRFGREPFTNKGRN
jgi:hypothetical protein